MKKLFLLLLPIATLLLCACSKDSDDEPNTPSEELEDRTVINLSNPEESGIDVISLDDDGTITAEVPEDKVPEVGDYLCSGITDYAPYGMMLKVTEVQRLEYSGKTRRSVRQKSKDEQTEIKVWKYVFKTVKVAINEIIGNINITYQVPVNDFAIDKIVDADGNTITEVEHVSDAWNLTLPLKFKQIKATSKVGITPQHLTFYLTTKNHQLKKLGANFIGNFDTYVKIDASLSSKFKDSQTLYYAICKPITIETSPYTPPLVITPLFIVYVGVEINGKLTASFVPFHNKYDFNVGGIWNSEQNKIVPASGNSLFNVSESPDFVSGRGVTNWEKGFQFDGSSIVSFGASLSFGLYGCNLVQRIPELKDKFKWYSDFTTADFRIDVNGRLSGTFGMDDIGLTAKDGNIHITDPCSLDVYAQGHAEFFLGSLNKEFKTNPSKIGEIWKDSKFPTMFVSEFDDVTYETNGDNIVFSTAKYKPYFGYGLFKEQGFGFRYMESDEYGNRKGDWKTVNLKSVYGDVYDKLFKFNINTSVPLSNFNNGSVYYVCPYVYTMMPNGQLAYIHRDGKFFRITKEHGSAENKTFTVNGVSFNMIVVEGGTFMMGADDNDEEAYDDEKPAHKVTLSSYMIGQTEVTQALWQTVMGNNPSYFTGDSRRPVEWVSWDDCQEFLRKLNSITGQHFRLPTEAEWEFAARGGVNSRGYKYSVSNTLDNVAWYDVNSYNTTHPVGTKQPNELGIYDMSGNVYEWCSDWYGSYSSGSQTNPQGPSSGSSRVLRGGCWYNFTRYCRVSYRGSNCPDYRNNNLGLRLAF